VVVSTDRIWKGVGIIALVAMGTLKGGMRKILDRHDGREVRKRLATNMMNPFEICVKTHRRGRNWEVFEGGSIEMVDGNSIRSKFRV